MTDSSVNNILRAGLDAGSTTVKFAVAGADGTVLFHAYRRHHADIGATLREVIGEAATKLGADTSIEIAVTGSAGMGVADKRALPFIQESVAAAAFAKRFFPETRALADIGGEDAKLIFLSPGNAPDIRMNGSCAGGTGAFIDQIATLLDCAPADLDALARASTNTHPVASRCGVFAKTDIQNLLARNVPKADIAASCFDAVARQIVASLARGREIEPPVLLCGGPLTFLEGLRKSLAAAFGVPPERCALPANSELVPALGCTVAAGVKRKAITLGELRDGCRGGADETAAAAVQPKTSRAACAGTGGANGTGDDCSRPEAPAPAGTLAPLFRDAAELAAWRARKERQLPAGSVAGAPRGEVVLGVDSGSTTTKIVALDALGRVVFTHYAPNNGDPLEALRAGLERFRDAAAGVPVTVIRAAVTGYGEDLLRAAFGFEEGVVETLAHYEAARSLDAGVSFLLDIGGQDMKAVFIENGAITRLDINEACSSGCGSFIETFARSLGMGAAEFARLACEEARRPCDLGTRCTVFMNSKVKQAQRENATRADIAAGLAYSVAKNCLYKVLKLKSVAELGPRVVVQGGAMRNQAVPRALELLTGLDITIAPSPELMGAYGAALRALASWRKSAAGGATGGAANAAAAGRPLAEICKPLARETADSVCAGCENRCVVRKHVFGNGNTFYAGNKCERVFSNRGTAAAKGANFHAFKTRLLWKRAASLQGERGTGSGEREGSAAAEGQRDKGKGIRAEGKGQRAATGGAGAQGSSRAGGVHAAALPPCSPLPAPRSPSIGVPRALNFFENFPFWHALLTRAGFNVVLSAPSTFNLYGAGARSIMSDNICFPAKLVHGHVLDLLAKGVSRIFMPFILQEAGCGAGGCGGAANTAGDTATNTGAKKPPTASGGSVRQFNCPIVSGYSDVIRSAVDTAATRGVPLDSPVVTFADPVLLRKAVLAYLTGTLGVARATAAAAFDAALAARDEFENALAAEARRILDANLAANAANAAGAGATAANAVVAGAARPLIVLAGRPYHADPLIQHKVSDMLAAFGADVISEDVVRAASLQEWSVASGQWPVVSGSQSKGARQAFRSGGTDAGAPRSAAGDEPRKILPRPERLADGDDARGKNLRDDPCVPEGGDIRADQSNSAGGGFRSLEHSGGKRPQEHGGVSELPLHRQRLAGGGGDAVAARDTSGLPTGEPTSGIGGVDSRNGANARGVAARAFGAERPARQPAITAPAAQSTDHRPLTTDPCTSPWAYPNRILAAAAWVGTAPANVHFVQLTSFGCGPDAFIIDEVGERLRRAGKSHTVLKVDDINNPGSLRLRARSLIESLAAAAPVTAPAAESALPASPAARPHKVAPFLAEDRRRTILIPFFSEIYSPFIPALMRLMGYKAETLPPADPESADLGLQHANNEICYPATLVIGDFMRALKSGRYDRREIALGITQTGGQCRATSYLALIKRALLTAGYADIPVVAVGTVAGAVANDQPGFQVKWAAHLHGLIEALLYADNIGQFFNAAAPREREPGLAARLRDRFIAEGVACMERGDVTGFRGLLRRAVGEFNAAVERRDCPRVGVVGEIFVKYNAAGNRNIVDWLVRQGVEPVVPPLGDFFLQEIPNRQFNRRNALARRSWTDLVDKLAYRVVRHWQNIYAEIAANFAYYRPQEDVFAKQESASRVVSLAAQYGEGWLIPAELASFAESGVNNAVSLQPFGCIANHLVAKGVERRIRQLYPRMNLLFLDLDGGVSEANLFNRMHFIVQNARDEMEARRAAAFGKAA